MGFSRPMDGPKADSGLIAVWLTAVFSSTEHPDGAHNRRGSKWKQRYRGERINTKLILYLVERYTYLVSNDFEASLLRRPTDRSESVTPNATTSGPDGRGVGGFGTDRPWFGT